MPRIWVLSCGHLWGVWRLLSPLSITLNQTNQKGHISICTAPMLFQVSFEETQGLWRAMFDKNGFQNKCKCPGESFGRQSGPRASLSVPFMVCKVFFDFYDWAFPFLNFLRDSWIPFPAFLLIKITAVIINERMCLWKDKALLDISPFLEIKSNLFLIKRKINKQLVAFQSHFFHCVHLHSTVSHLLCITLFLQPTHTIFLKLNLTLIVKA